MGISCGKPVQYMCIKCLFVVPHPYRLPLHSRQGHHGASTATKEIVLYASFSPNTRSKCLTPSRQKRTIPKTMRADVFYSHRRTRGLKHDGYETGTACGRRPPMLPARIFSAPSLSEVIQQLMLNRLSGLLTFRRATGTYQDEASILVEEGQRLLLRWRGYEGEANEPILRQLDTWGEIHFLFLPRGAPRQLPPPSQPALQGPFRPHHSLKPTRLRFASLHQ
jgi:hypothetical protein